MATSSRPRPLVVTILDGWGISFVKEGNAIMAATTPTMDMFARHYPSAGILAAGIEVGLPWGEVGNSETGHSNIGAGQVQYQALPSIDKAIEDRSFFANQVLLQAIAHVKRNNSNLHIMGLASTGGVHAHLNHLFALLRLVAHEQIYDHVFLHLFTDGRDSPPQSALAYLRQTAEVMAQYKIGKIASVTGRLYAMDRNENWERTQATFNLLTGGPRQVGASTAEQAVTQAYERNIFDEMIPPTAITEGGGPLATIRDNDAVIFFNYRPDRARQITRAFVETDFTNFRRPTVPTNLFFATMTQYDPRLPAPAAFIEEPVALPLAKVISQAGLTQLHIAETEKYAHITYYLNGGHEQPFPGEEHVLIKSSGIKNFAERPHMEAEAITDRLLHEIQRGLFDVYFVNLANADMVGHSGDIAATIEACTFVDQCLARLHTAVQAAHGALLVTADHGNAEEKLHPKTKAVETDHTSNPVPLHYVIEHLRRTTPRSEAELVALFSSPIGVLADIAPTILDILDIPLPPHMTGISLLNSLQ
ncbi:MAG: 2,3-bisphosphoglycerate-independent phosphoglycerate mutase [Candidatus Andersenbacteria bacterium]